MKIVLDTNILCQDYFFEKPHFRVLFEGASAVPLTIHIPEVVLDELVNRYREDLEETLQQYQKIARSLGALVRDDYRTVIDISSKAAQYRAFLNKFQQDRHIEIIPYPDIPHKQIVERDLARKKPFKRDGSGYRDTLIWENVKRVMLWGDEKVVFITNNLKDFGEGPLIDTDLQSEIRNVHKLQIYQSLKHFNDDLVVPKLKKLEKVRLQLQNEKLGDFDIRDWLKHNLLNLLWNYELEGILAGFPQGVGSARVSEIIEFKEIEVGEVSALADENKLVTVHIKFDARCSIDSDWEDFVNHSEVREFWGDNGEKFSSVWMYMDEIIDLTVDLVIDGAENKVDSEELVKIFGDYGELDFGR